ncbi:hypothetical protein CCE01nite_28580 [Cellulomonas cellasea]|nr:hypothetical protein CCE01nite_28580 [Cellulomonas cellasea]
MRGRPAGGTVRGMSENTESTRDQTPVNESEKPYDPDTDTDTDPDNLNPRDTTSDVGGEYADPDADPSNLNPRDPGTV